MLTNIPDEVLWPVSSVHKVLTVVIVGVQTLSTLRIIEQGEGPWERKGLRKIHLQHRASIKTLLLISNFNLTIPGLRYW